MSVIETLLETAYMDSELLGPKYDEGDDLQLPRDVDFVFSVSTQELAKTLIDLVQDNQYGRAKLEPTEAGFQVIVTVHINPVYLGLV